MGSSSSSSIINSVTVRVEFAMFTLVLCKFPLGSPASFQHLTTGK